MRHDLAIASVENIEEKLVSISITHPKKLSSNTNRH
jgi:hypothetical protein